MIIWVGGNRRCLVARLLTMKQMQIRKTSRPKLAEPVDTRTPSGKGLRF
jgi:hypothetical protein